MHEPAHFKHALLLEYLRKGLIGRNTGLNFQWIKIEAFIRTWLEYEAKEVLIL